MILLLLVLISGIVQSVTVIKLKQSINTIMSLHTNPIRLLHNIQKIRSNPYGLFGQKSASISTSEKYFDKLNWKTNHEDFHPISKCNIVTFNMLAPCYKRTPTLNNKSMRESSSPEKWSIRANYAFNFLRRSCCPTTSIIALQEFWVHPEFLHMFREGFEKEGYQFRYLQRTGSKMDAVAFFIKEEDFAILGSENIFLCSQGDRVALLLWLRHKKSGKNFLIANTHLSFPHTIFDKMSQVRQVQKLTEDIEAFAVTHGIRRCTQIILGDFNVEGKSPVCDHLRESGYFSCFEVSPPNNTDADEFDWKQQQQQQQSLAASHIYNDDNNNNNEAANNQETDASSSLWNSENRSFNQDTMDYDDDSEHSYHLPIEYGSAQHHDSLQNSIEGGSSTTINTVNKAKSAAAAATAAAAPSLTPADIEALRKKRTTKSKYHFVSHYNHRQEEVGVDHIFIKPDTEQLVLNDNSCLITPDNKTRLQSSTSATAADKKLVFNTTMARWLESLNESIKNADSASASASLVQTTASDPLNLNNSNNNGNNNNNNNNSSISKESLTARIIDDSPCLYTNSSTIATATTATTCISTTTADSSSSSANHSNSNNNSTCMELTKTTEEFTSSSSSSASSTTIIINNQTIAANASPYSHDESYLFVASSQVLPKSLDSSVWPQIFQISDHRPVGTTLVVASCDSTTSSYNEN